MTTFAFNQQLKRDPTQTTVLRNQFRKEMRKRMTAVRRLIKTSVADNDALRLGNTLSVLQSQPASKFDFPSDINKLPAFMDWLRSVMDIEVLGGDGYTAGHWQNAFIRQAYIAGIKRAETELRKAGIDIPFVDIVTLPLDLPGVTVPVNTPALEMLYIRNFELLRGVNEAVASAVQQELTQGMLTGLGPRAMAKKLIGRVDVIGKVRAERIARTEVIRAFNEAALSRYEQAGLSQVSGKAEFSTAGDNRVCPICAGLEGKIYTVKEARGVIPVHPNCLFPDTLITSAQGIAAISKRVYEGDLCVLTTATGKQISVTPNHPILTKGGWIMAKHVNIGDNMFSGRFDGFSFGSNETNHRPSTIEEMFDSSLIGGSFLPIEMPVSPEDFHGDVDVRNPDVAVVLINRQLLDRSVPCIHQSIENDLFIDAFSSPISLLGSGSLDYFLLANSSPLGSLVGGFNLLNSLSFSHPFPFNRFGFGLGTSMDATINESFSDSRSGDLITLGDGVLGDAAQIQFDDFVNWQTERLVSSKTVSFSGHVYNLQTKNGYYGANNIITHNCRCTWLPVIPKSVANLLN